MPSPQANSDCLGLIKPAKAVNLYTHINLDGDAVGSVAALYHLLSVTKEVRFVTSEEICPMFREFLDGVEMSSEPIEGGLNIIIDSVRLKKITGQIDARQLKSSTILIDHHLQSDIAKKVTAKIFDTEAAATCELVYRFAKQARYKINRQVATALLSGIYTDTGGFQHPNTCQRTLQTASELVSLGADMAMITRCYSDKRGLSKSRLWGQAMQRMSFNKYGLVVVKIDQETFDRCESSPEDVNGLANFLCKVDGARASMVAIEKDDGWKVVVRSRDGQFDAGKVAKYFGGKGSKKASGFSVELG